MAKINLECAANDFVEEFKKIEKEHKNVFVESVTNGENGKWNFEIEVID